MSKAIFLKDELSVEALPTATLEPTERFQDQNHPVLQAKIEFWRTLINLKFNCSRKTSYAMDEQKTLVLETVFYWKDEKFEINVWFRHVAI